MPRMVMVSPSSVATVRATRAEEDVAMIQLRGSIRGDEGRGVCDAVLRQMISNGGTWKMSWQSVCRIRLAA